MAGSTGLATALAVVKGHAVALAVVGTLVLGGGAAAVAVTTGAVHVPGGTTQQVVHGTATGTSSSSTLAACTKSGDAQRLADLFAPMFDSKDSAKQSICTLFVGSDGHAVGFGEVQQVLEITAAIELNGGAADCLTTAGTHGQGTPTTKGKPAVTPFAGTGTPSFTAPTSTTAVTMDTVKQVFAAAKQGTPLAQLALNCGASHATGNPGTSDPGQLTGTPGHP